MSDRFGIKIDLSRLATKLSGSGGTIFQNESAATWLLENGFEDVGDHWIAEAARLFLLDPSEILAMWPIDELGGEAKIWCPASVADSAHSLGTTSYVLAAEQRASFRLMPQYADCIIPKFLIGTPRVVLSKWRTLAKRIVRNAEFGNIIPRSDFIHVDDAPGDFLARHTRGFSPRNENIVLYPIMEEFFTIIYHEAADRNAQYLLRKKLLLDGLNSFWFTLCFLVGVGWLPVMPPEYDKDKRDAATLIVGRLSRWWPHLCIRNNRFAYADGMRYAWPHWARGVFGVLDSEDVRNRLQYLSCEAAGQLLFSSGRG